MRRQGLTRFSLLFVNACENVERIISMRHLIGRLCVDNQLLYGMRCCYSMLTISNFGFTFKRSKKGSIKEKIPPKRESQNHY